MPTGYMASMYVPGATGTSGQAGSTDSYLTQLQSTLDRMMSGNLYPQTNSQVGVKVQRLTPEEEQNAYNTSGFQSLLSDPNFGQISDQQLQGYYDLSQPYMFDTGMQNINQILSQAGWAPGGANGQAPAGTQAEMAARLKAQLGSQVAQGLIQNAQTGATARANLGANVAGSRYGTLTVPNVFSMSQSTKPGAGTTGVQQNPSTIGTGSNTYAGGSSSGGQGGQGGGFTALGGSASPGGGSTGGGGGAGGGGAAGGGGGTAGTYREPTPWEIESMWNQMYGGTPTYGTTDQYPYNSGGGYDSLTNVPESEYWTPESGGSGPGGAGTAQSWAPDTIGWINVEGPHQGFYGTQAQAAQNTANGYKSTWTAKTW